MPFSRCARCSGEQTAPGGDIKVVEGYATGIEVRPGHKEYTAIVFMPGHRAAEGDRIPDMRLIL
ncbi:MAG: hypothetical protein MZV70_30700 [Desulfobacterales bacterium]|nr:hypothetical protein [Desulfobacterales bacterium]